MRPWALAAVLAALLLLPGCSQKEPTGTLVSQGYSTPVAGTATLQYQAFTGSNPSGGLPSPLNSTLECAQNSDPTNQIPVPHCQYASTNVTLSFTALPMAAGGEYKVALVGANRTLDLGALAVSDNGTATVTKRYDEDYTGQFDRVELTFNGFHYAQAPAQAGEQKFALVASVNQLTVTATYTGSALTGTVSGLEPNVTYRGRLYLPNANGELVSVEDFAITPDAAGAAKLNYVSKTRQISEFKEFHIHVGDGKLNVFKSTVTPDA
jgi:hypothetical protein